MNKLQNITTIYKILYKIFSNLQVPYLIIHNYLLILYEKKTDRKLNS